MDKRDKKKIIEKQLIILKESIREMLDLDKNLMAFRLSQAKEYTAQAKELFSQLLLKNYIRIETTDINTLCKESLDKWDKIYYFIGKNKKTEASTFQQVFYSIKSQKTALTLGCSLYLLLFENLLAQFDDKAIIRIFADLKNKNGLNIGNYISAYSKIEILRRFDESNTSFLQELDRKLRNAIGHFDFQIHNTNLICGTRTLTKKELREKTKKTLWLTHIVLLNKDLAIREHLLKSHKQ